MRSLLGILLLSMVLLSSASAYAANQDKLIMCNNCNSKSDFETRAKTINFGLAVVANSQTATAYAFHVSYEPEIGEYIIEDMPLPAGVQNTLDLYIDMQNAFNQFQFTSNISTGAKSIAMKSTRSSANGCGTGWNLYLVPDMPFESACNNHDNCYASSNSKQYCDEKFLAEMIKISTEITNQFKAANTVVQYGPLVDALIKVLLEQMANTYYSFVDAFGNSAYCNATTSEYCFPEVPENATWTTLFSQPDDSNYLTPFRSVNCELWEFPDGNGGTYELLLNCVFVP